MGPLTPTANSLVGVGGALHLGFWDTVGALRTGSAPEGGWGLLGEAPPHFPAGHREATCSCPLGPPEMRRLVPAGLQCWLLFLRAAQGSGEGARSQPPGLTFTPQLSASPKATE